MRVGVSRFYSAHHRDSHGYWNNSYCTVFLSVHCKTCEKAVDRTKVAVASRVHGISLIKLVEGDDGSIPILLTTSELVICIPAVRRAIGTLPCGER